MQDILLLVFLFASLSSTVTAGWMQSNNYEGSRNSVNFKRNFEAYRRVHDRNPHNESSESEESDEHWEKRVIVDGSNSKRVPKVNQPLRNSGKHLQYDLVPAIEQQLVEDLANLILDKEDYKLFLSNPEKAKLKEMLKKYISPSAQKILQKKVSERLHEIEVYYSRYIDTMTDPSDKKKVSKFLESLKNAKKNGTLTGEDLLSLAKLHTQIPFMMTDSKFKKTFESLVEIYRDSEKQSSDKSSGSKSSFYHEKSGGFRHHNSIDGSILDESDASAPLVDDKNSTRIEDPEEARKHDQSSRKSVDASKINLTETTSTPSQTNESQDKNQSTTNSEVFATMTPDPFQQFLKLTDVSKPSRSDSGPLPLSAGNSASDSESSTTIEQATNANDPTSNVSSSAQPTSATIESNTASLENVTSEDSSKPIAETTTAASASIKPLGANSTESSNKIGVTTTQSNTPDASSTTTAVNRKSASEGSGVTSPPANSTAPAITTTDTADH